MMVVNVSSEIERILEALSAGCSFERYRRAHRISSQLTCPIVSSVPAPRCGLAVPNAKRGVMIVI